MEVVQDAGDPVAHEGLKPPWVSVQPLKYDCTVTPCKCVSERDVQCQPCVGQQFGEERCSTQLQTWNR